MDRKQTVSPLEGTGNVDNCNFWDELNFFDSLYDVEDGELGDGGFAPPLVIPKPEAPHLKVEEFQDAAGGRMFSGAMHETPMLNPAMTLHPPPQQASPIKVEQSEGNTQTVKKKAGKNGDKNCTDAALLAKRKKAVIAAKANREKRKREIDDLRKSNAELMQERREFRKIVADLQLQVQANREAGEIDLETENELLRAELQEHKSFIAQFKRLADGSAVSNTAKHVATLKGAKAAVGQVLGLINTSTVDPSWKRGKSRLHPELGVLYQRLPLGSSVKTASRINMRVDVPPFQASIDHLHQIQWRVWSDSDLSSRLSRHFGEVREKEIKEVDLDLDDIECEPDSKVKVYYYREKRVRENDEPGGDTGEETTAERTDTLDTIFLITSKKQDLPYNALPVEHSLSEEGSRVPKPAEDPKVYPTIVMATTSTQHSKDIVSTKPGVHRIESALLEGMVLRQMENGLVSATYMSSYPLNLVGKYSATDFLSATNSEGWIDEDGFLSSAADQAGNDMMRIYAESLGPEVARSYLAEAELAVQGHASTQQR